MNKQFYNEGFATTFYQKPKNYILKHVKNKNVANILIFLIKVLYTILAISFAVIILYYKLKK